jgi:hypothetical protein
VSTLLPTETRVVLNYVATLLSGGHFLTGVLKPVLSLIMSQRLKMLDHCQPRSICPGIRSLTINSATTLMTSHNAEGACQEDTGPRLTMNSVTALMTSHNAEGACQEDAGPRLTMNSVTVLVTSHNAEGIQSLSTSWAIISARWWKHPNCWLKQVRCAFFDRDLHSRMPLDPTPLLRFKRTCV